mmetsp:Transcript_16574/g.52704  ORF Transcript_16574/g.52704 Transcript_16574/m.52704 type:complete len:266 (-) Transcript_16574:110-907(-)
MPAAPDRAEAPPWAEVRAAPALAGNRLLAGKCRRAGRPVLTAGALWMRWWSTCARGGRRCGSASCWPRRRLRASTGRRRPSPPSSTARGEAGRAPRFRPRRRMSGCLPEPPHRHRTLLGCVQGAKDRLRQSATHRRCIPRASTDHRSQLSSNSAATNFTPWPPPTAPGTTPAPAPPLAPRGRRRPAQTSTPARDGSRSQRRRGSCRRYTTLSLRRAATACPGRSCTPSCPASASCGRPAHTPSTPRPSRPRRLAAAACSSTRTRK